KYGVQGAALLRQAKFNGCLFCVFLILYVGCRSNPEGYFAAFAFYGYIFYQVPAVGIICFPKYTSLGIMYFPGCQTAFIIRDNKCQIVRVKSGLPAPALGFLF